VQMAIFGGADHQGPEFGEELWECQRGIAEGTSSRSRRSTPGLSNLRSSPPGSRFQQAIWIDSLCRLAACASDDERNRAPERSTRLKDHPLNQDGYSTNRHAP